MYHVRVHIDAVRRAYEQGSAERRYFLDVQTGEIVPIFVELLERGGNTEDVKRIAGEINERYFLIPYRPSHEGYAEMEAFIETVKDKRTQEQLSEAIEGKGAFRRFREILAIYPPDEERWIKLKNEKTEQEISGWLAATGIVLEENS